MERADIARGGGGGAGAETVRSFHRETKTDGFGCTNERNLRYFFRDIRPFHQKCSESVATECR